MTPQEADSARRVLVHAPERGDGASLCDLMRDHGRTALEIDTPCGLLQAIEEGFGAIVLTQEALKGDLGAALSDAFAAQPTWASAPVLVLLDDAETLPRGFGPLERVAARLDLVILQRPTGRRSIATGILALLQGRDRQYTLRDQGRTLCEREALVGFLHAELDHRVKNVLARIQGIANLTSRTASDLSSFSTAFRSRLDVLIRTHDMISGSGRRSVGLHAIVGGALALHLGPGPAERGLSGPEIRVPSQDAMALAMMFHELATNAAKHGALSHAAGSVRTAWAVTRRQDGDGLELSWRETGGPPPPPRRPGGLGTRMVERLAAHELKGRAEFRFAPGGLEFRLSMPVPVARSVPGCEDGG